MTSVSTSRRQGLNSSAAIKVACQVATTANITLAALQTIDGVALASGDRVLVKDQTTTSENGIYVADTGNWSRDIDFDGHYDVLEGTIVTVIHGSTLSATLWKVSTVSPVIGSALAFVQSSLSPADSNSVQFLQAGTGAVARTLQSKNRDIVSVKDFGAVGDGSTDDAAAILLAFNAIRTLGGGILDFTNGAVYLTSYGWLVPTNCTVRLNGSTIKATTTFGQGSIPTNATASYMFGVMDNLLSVVFSDYSYVTVDGGGGLIDMRRDEQTGTPPGAIGVAVQTSGVPIVGNEFLAHDILIKDLNIDQAMYYGTYVSGAKDVVFENVNSTYAGNIGHVIVSGWNITYKNCRGAYSQEVVASQGYGFWNETNQTWQILRNVRYYDCLADYNRKGGFKYSNDGQDVETSVYAFGCVSRWNKWNIATVAQDLSATAEAGHLVNKSNASASAFLVELNDCVADNEYEAGFKVIRVAAGTIAQRVILNHPLAVNCDKIAGGSYIRAPIHVGGANNASPVFINGPVVMGYATHTDGYALGSQYSQNVFVSSPRFVGTFAYKGIFANLPATRFNSTVPYAGWDVAFDEGGGHIGGSTAFYKPVRLASFDQTAEPSTPNDLFTNELAVWQDDNNQFFGIFKRDDSSTPKYVDFRPGKRLRGSGAYAGGTINTGTHATLATIAVTGAALANFVSRISLSVDSQGLSIFGNVSAANTVKVYAHNGTAGNITIAASTVNVEVEEQGV